MTRQLRITLSGLFLLLTLAVVHSARAQNTPQSQRPEPAPEAEGDQVTNIPYFTLRDGLSSMLTLDNNAPTPTKVNITIYDAEGRAQALDPMMLDPHSVKQIELKDVVLGELFDEGSLTVAYFGKEMDVTCQVSVYSLEKRVAFESREQGMMDFQSTNSNGILWLPQKGAEGFLAITNISKNKVAVQVSLAAKTRNIELYSHETRLLKLREEFGLRAPAAALVGLSQDGLAGDILTTGYVMDLEHGYSSAFTMFDPKNPRSSHLGGAHLRVGPADPEEGFPSGTTFTSPLLLANVTKSPVKAHVSVDYTVAEKLEMTPINGEKDATEEKFSTVAVRDVTVAPGEVHRIELSDELANLGIQTPVTEAGVDVAYDAPPGAMIAHLVSVDQTGDYSFEVPMKDPTAWNAMIEGINPWTLEDGTRTVLHLKNTTDQPEQAWTTFTFAGGSYNLPLLSFQPYQTIAIDIQALKDSQKPDARGIPFPAEATHGQAVWFPQTPYSLVGRAEQTNMSWGIARSFSCQVNCCSNYFQRVCVSTQPCAPNWQTFPPQPASIPVSGLTGAVGGSGIVTEYKYGQDCNANTFGPTAYSSGPWTYNSSVVSVNSSGNVSYVGAGSTSIGITSAPLIYYDWYTGCICHQHNYTPPAYTTVSNEQAPVTVQVPTFLNIVSEDLIQYSGSDQNVCGTNEPPVVWGNSVCVHYQLQDQNGHNITTGNFTASEALTVESDNPANQTFQPATNVPLLSGNLSDFLIYAQTAAPGIPVGTYAHVKQVITVKNTNTNAVYTVRINCNDYEYNGISITNITSGGSCT